MPIVNFTIKHIDRTSLDYDVYLKLLKKLSSSLSCDIVISFDLRIKDFGSYTYDYAKKRHIIKISPTACKKDGNITVGPSAEKYNLISTTLHELKHAMQQEELGNALWSKKYSCTKEIKNPNMSDFYSVSEVNARIFENKNILIAVDFYNSCCK